VLVYESFQFMKPGLYPHERRYFLAVVPVSVMLVAAGLAFSYLFALPLLFGYFLSYSQAVATTGLGLVETFDLIIMTSLAFGIVFQIPLLMYLAMKMKVASRRWFESKRVYVWGGIITVATIVTRSLDPTGDAGFLIAATMILLFESTLAYFRFLAKIRGTSLWGGEDKTEPDYDTTGTDTGTETYDSGDETPDPGSGAAGAETGAELDDEEVSYSDMGEPDHLDYEEMENLMDEEMEREGVGEGVETGSGADVDAGVGTGEREADEEMEDDWEYDEDEFEDEYDDFGDQAGMGGFQSYYVGAAEMAESGRQHIVKILGAFLIGILSTILFLRLYGFNRIKSDSLNLALKSAQGYVDEIEGVNSVNELVQTSFVNPFEVILLQAKIGIIMGVVFTVPVLLYFGRKPLKRRGYWPKGAWKRKRTVVGLGVGMVVLFVLGIAYAYFVMVPYILQFVTIIAIEAGIRPFYRISSLVPFVLTYSLIFGFVSQLPLIMVFVVKSGVMSYHFLRTKWRYFIVISAAIAGVVTSPDPMTQLVVLGPMVAVYVLGLGIVRVVASEQVKKEREMRERQEAMEAAEAETDGEAGDTAESDTDEETETDEGGLPGTDTDLVNRGLLDVASTVGNVLRGKMLRIGVFFILVTSAAFTWLVYDGIERIKNQTISFMPPNLASQVQTVQLEVFEVVFLVVKYSLIIGIIFTLPVLLYYSRNALREQGFISGDASWFYYLSRFSVVLGLF
ncbi:MAG: twin-arginine translocase subunit TatC, partial [Halobacteria archaeon]|nr:twin-arginine translocase subunit TatC [Halobacteria archaeon]